LSAHQRKQVKGEVPADYFDEIERTVVEAFGLGRF
jgi:hypothetical protein